MHKTTIKDIARNTGTSVASVHRALHGSEGVGEELKRRILEEARRSHYQVDESASLLRRNGINITVLLPKPEGNERFYYAGLWQGIRRGSERLGKMKASVTMVETMYGIDDIADALEALYDETDGERPRMDGLITICDDERAGMWISRFIKRGTQVALVDRALPIEGLTCTARVPVADMGRLSMELAGLYYRQESAGPILLLNGSRERASYQVYSAAFQERMREFPWKEGVRPALIEIFSEDEQQLRSSLRQLLKMERPGVVVAASARTTYWVCDEIKQHYDPGRINSARMSPAPDHAQMPPVPDHAQMPPVIGTDVFPELAPFFETRILKAAIYQSHLTSGEHCMDLLFQNILAAEKGEEHSIEEPLFVVMRDNFRFFLSGKKLP